MEHGCDTRDDLATMLASAYDVTPHASIVTDGCVVLFANAEARRLFRCEDRSQVEGRSVLEIVHPDGHHSMKLRAEILLNASQRLRGLPVKLVALDGSTFSLVVEATTVEYQGKRVFVFTSER